MLWDALSLDQLTSVLTRFWFLFSDVMRQYCVRLQDSRISERKISTISGTDEKARSGRTSLRVPDVGPYSRPPICTSSLPAANSGLNNALPSHQD